MKLISMAELKPVKGIVYSRPHLYRLIHAGAFPKPIKLGGNRIAFVESEIDGWLDAKVAARDGTAE